MRGKGVKWDLLGFRPGCWAFALWPWGRLLVSPPDSLAARASGAGAHPAGRGDLGVPGDTVLRMLQMPCVPRSRYMQDTAPRPQPSSPNRHWHPRAPSTAQTQITPCLEQPKPIRAPGGSSASPSTLRQPQQRLLHCQALLKIPLAANRSGELWCASAQRHRRAHQPSPAPAQPARAPLGWARDLLRQVL